MKFDSLNTFYVNVDTDGDKMNVEVQITVDAPSAPPDYPAVPGDDDD